MVWVAAGSVDRPSVTQRHGRHTKRGSPNPRRCASVGPTCLGGHATRSRPARRRKRWGSRAKLKVSRAGERLASSSPSKTSNTVMSWVTLRISWSITGGRFASFILAPRGVAVAQVLTSSPLRSWSPGEAAPVTGQHRAGSGSVVGDQEVNLTPFAFSPTRGQHRMNRASLLPLPAPGKAPKRALTLGCSSKRLFDGRALWREPAHAILGDVHVVFQAHAKLAGKVNAGLVAEGNVGLEAPGRTVPEPPSRMWDRSPRVWVQAVFQF